MMGMENDIGPRLLLHGPVASVVLASWSTLFTETMAASGRLCRGALVMRQSTVAIERISCPLCTRCSHLECGALFPVSLYLAVIVLGVLVLLMSTKIGFFWR